MCANEPVTLTNKTFGNAPVMIAGLALGTGSLALVLFGNGSPQGVQAAPVGSTYHRLDGGAGTSFYVKESGAATSSGWVAK